MSRDDGGPPRARTRAPGEDDEDPYSDADLSAYPAWWRTNIDTFRAHGMRPYRPPRFADGTVVPTLIAELEAELGITIRLRGVDPTVGDDWGIHVDREQVATVGRERVGDGYTEYKLSADEFERIIRQHSGEH